MENDFKFQYMMLSRLQSDCEYFLNYGGGSLNILRSNSMQEHISEMRKLWNELPVKPEWLSWEKIDQYEKDMLNKNLE